MVSRKTQRYHTKLLNTYGYYITHKGKALNPEDVAIIFRDEKSEIGETSRSFLEVMGTVKKDLGRKSVLEKVFKL